MVRHSAGAAPRRGSAVVAGCRSARGKRRRGQQEAFGGVGPPVGMQIWPPASLGRRRGRGAAAPVPLLGVCDRETEKEETGEDWLEEEKKSEGVK